MKVAVVGLWHLGSVTAACTAAAGHQVAAWDPDPAVRDGLRGGRAPIAEPGLDDLLAQELAGGRLAVEDDLARAVAGAEVVWVTFDTPVDEEDRADVEYVLGHVRAAATVADAGAIVLLSSQLPVGTSRQLERDLGERRSGRPVSFACSPENLRLGTAIAAFQKADRVVVGVRSDRDRDVLARLFESIAPRIEWMSVESAEMTKHAINAFLAVSVTFINELAVLCEQVGADAKQVERGLKTEPRIGPRAYLSPGGAFAGGTLARDVAFLTALGEATSTRTPLLAGIRESNTHHREWARRALAAALGDLRGRRIAVWGLTYKPGTNTLRRSSSVELCRWLAAEGAEIAAFDPAVPELPADLGAVVRTAPDALAAAAGADALVVATEWPAFRTIDAGAVIEAMRGRVVCDANRFLAASLGDDARVRYVTVGEAPLVSGILSGRAALITGANQGLGLEIARAYVREGASVLLCARDAAMLERARDEVAGGAGAGQRVEIMPADVSKPPEVAALAARAFALFPQLHVLVNNAGVYGPLGPSESVDWEAWTRAVEINLYGSVLPVRAVLPHFKQHRYGKIVQLSGGGATNPLPRISSYAASKAAIVRFAESVALEVKEFGIDVNAIAPGALNTRMMDEVIAAGPETVGSAFHDRMLKTQQSGGTPLDKGAALAVFLASAASDGITGRLLSAVWDPWADLPNHREQLDASDVYTLRRITAKDRNFEWETE